MIIMTAANRSHTDAGAGRRSGSRASQSSTGSTSPRMAVRVLTHRPHDRYLPRSVRSAAHRHRSADRRARTPAGTAPAPRAAGGRGAAGPRAATPPGPLPTRHVEPRSGRASRTSRSASARQAASCARRPRMSSVRRSVIARSEVLLDPLSPVRGRGFRSRDASSAAVRRMCSARTRARITMAEASAWRARPGGAAARRPRPGRERCTAEPSYRSRSRHTSDLASSRSSTPDRRPGRSRRPGPR